MIKFMLVTDTLCTGWIVGSMTTDAHGNHAVDLYDTREAAQAEIDDDIAEIQGQIERGERDPEDGLDEDDDNGYWIEAVEPLPDGGVRFIDHDIQWSYAEILAQHGIALPDASPAA
jgi:hypothetical protein